jgi:hypothetical protein
MKRLEQHIIQRSTGTNEAALSGGLAGAVDLLMVPQKRRCRAYSAPTMAMQGDALDVAKTTAASFASARDHADASSRVNAAQTRALQHQTDRTIGLAYEGRPDIDANQKRCTRLGPSDHPTIPEVVLAARGGSS